MNYHSSLSSWDSSKLSALSVVSASGHNCIPEKGDDSLSNAGSDATEQAAPAIIWYKFSDRQGHAIKPADTQVGLAEVSQ